ncbi:hypothetical protein CEXT_94591 [Caerostris extrusa]|uniref:Uncharacterized protein n=1 Tax=Caerostris extrusa TaxID=172846 RepID=A0AAV4QPU4_CAEEX|nr:hypothetical protein CEXT_94591 [Caerostris extrusa]
MTFVTLQMAQVVNSEDITYLYDSTRTYLSSRALMTKPDVILVRYSISPDPGAMDCMFSWHSRDLHNGEQQYHKTVNRSSDGLRSNFDSVSRRFAS